MGVKLFLVKKKKKNPARHLAQLSVCRYSCKSPITCDTDHEMGKCVGRVFKKNSPRPNAASHNNTSGYADTDWFLEHSPGRGSLYYKGPTLQRIILGFLGPPLYLGETFLF